MKKLIVLMLTLAMLALLGCQQRKELPTTTIVTEQGEQKELPLVTVTVDEPMWQSSNFLAFLRTVPGYDKEFHVEYELIDMEPMRSYRMENLRVEVMAGKGPDLFLVDCYFTTLGGYMMVDEDMEVKSLFPFPEQVMNNHIFLPLDEYIENAQFMDMDQLMPQIMEVGQGEEGQMILPLQYDFYAMAMDKDLYTEPPAPSREGYLQSGNRYLERAALGDNIFGMLHYFGRDADYAKEELTFTEEELLEIALGVAEGSKKHGEGYYPEPASPWFLGSHLQNGRKADEVYVPVYNRDQGVTAFVTNFGAVNRNANYPEYAFRILDKLLDKGTQKNAALYGWSEGLVPSLAQGTENLQGITMDPETARQFMDIRDKINAVKFCTDMDREAQRQLFMLCQKDGAAQDQIEKAVRDTYRTMKMMLAES